MEGKGSTVVHLPFSSVEHCLDREIRFAPKPDKLRCHSIPSEGMGSQSPPEAVIAQRGDVGGCGFQERSEG